MSNKLKYFSMTATCTIVAVGAFFMAYSFFKPPLAIELGQSEEHIIGEKPGIQIDEHNIENPAELTPKEDDAANEEITAAISIDDRINKDTRIVYEYYYSDIEKTAKSEQSAPFALQGLKREELSKKIQGFKVISFSPNEVVLRKTIGGKSEKKYILGISNGFVAVFYCGAEGVRDLKEVTDTPVSALSDDEQQKLGIGIEITGDESLMKVLEDYGS